MLPKIPAGIRSFTIIWSGQLVSTIGTSMSRFALAIWAWELTHQALPLTLTAVFMSISSIVVSPVAGALVDRWDRKKVMLVSDVAAALCTLTILLLHLSGSLQIWHLYITGVVVGASGVFQNLAYSAVRSTLVPKTEYARISGMISLSEYSSFIAAPVLGGLLVPLIGLAGVLVIDLVTFLVAVITLWMVTIPYVRPVHAEGASKPGLFSESVYGFRYIFQRPGLLGLMIISFAFNMTESLGYPLIAPMILARTGNSETILGTVQGVMGLGGVLGGVVLTIWGGPKRRIHGLLLGVLLTGLMGDMLMGLGQVFVVWIVAGFFLEFFIPVTVGSASAIWQIKVPPELQGRVFAARQLVSQLAVPVTTILGGLLADRVFEPLLTSADSSSGGLATLVGTGPGAGMGLLIMFCGIFSALVGIVGYLFRSIRDVEDQLPDHDYVASAT